MSKPIQIAEHQEALSAYLNDMLLEPSTDIDSAIHVSLEQPPANENKDWHLSPFQALLCDIHGLKLAIPLHELSGILTWPNTTMPKISGKPNWYLGLYSQPNQHTQVVDTAHIILPRQHRDKTAKPSFIVIIDEGRWGLACTHVTKVVTLSPEEVRWRQHPGKRPWLAGTVLDQMCSILNITELVKQLEN